MRVRFHRNPDGEPHIGDHNVDEQEVLEALARPMERVRGKDDSEIVIGRASSGRVLRIIVADAWDGDGIFVITAYDLPDKQYRALRRRLGRKPK